MYTITKLRKIDNVSPEFDDNGSFDGTSTNHVYYDVGMQLSLDSKKEKVTNALNQDTHFKYNLLPLDKDGNGMITYTDSPDGGWRRSLQDVASNMVLAWDEREHKYRNEYDDLRRQHQSYVDEGTGEILVSYMIYGDDFNISTPEATNLRGQLIRIFDQSGLQQNTSFDFKGNPIITTKRLANNYKNSIDWSTLLTETSLEDLDDAAIANFLETEDYTNEVEMDALNRPTKLTMPDDSEQVPSYSRTGFLTKMEVQLAHESSFTEYVSSVLYNVRGQRTDIFYGNGSKTAYTYDEANFRLTRLLTTRNTGSDILQDLNCTYDAVGNIVEQKDDAQQTQYFSNTVIEPKGKYVYDALYRLIQATGREKDGLAAPTHLGNTPDFVATNAKTSPTLSTYCEKYTYDELGNMLEVSHKDTCGGTENWKRTYVYNSGKNNNYLQSAYTGSTAPSSAQFTYDTHGNMQQMPHLAAMNWDFQDQLKSTEKTDETTYYVYSGGERTRKVVVDTSGATDKIKYERIYLGGYELYKEYDGSEELENERTTHHVSDDKKRITLLEVKTRTAGSDILPANQTTISRYEYTNHLDSASLELNESAEILSYEEYYPFGSTSYSLHTNDSEVSLKRYKYENKERDNESGLYYFGARYYAPWLCRFLSCDPMKEKRSWLTPYNYVQNNPINLSDPDGALDNGGGDDDTQNGSGTKLPVVYQTCWYCRKQ